MAKGRDTRKNVKKEPLKTAKEKRAAKKLKKANKGQTSLPFIMARFNNYIPQIKKEEFNDLNNQVHYEFYLIIRRRSVSISIFFGSP